MTQRKGDPFDPDMQIDLTWFNDGVFVCDTVCGKVNYHNYTHKIPLEGHASDTSFSWLTFSDLV